MIAAWNARAVLEPCLDSLEAQDWPGELDVVVVDDASTDSTPELLGERTGIRSVRNPEPVGYCAAINQGAELARGDVVLLCNSDVEFVNPDSVRRLVEELGRPGVGLVAPRYVRPDGTAQPGLARFPGIGRALVVNLGLHRLMPDRLKARIAPEHSSHAHSRDADWLMGAVIGIDTALFRELGGYWALMYASEEDLAWRVGLRGLRTRFVADSLVVHVGNFSNRQRWSDPDRAARVACSELVFLDTHYGRLRAGAIRAITWAGAIARVPILRLSGRAGRAAEYRATARVYRRGSDSPLES
ncbi:MAG: hypothetical protein QOG62_1708 [Thermoleophilaceae bacterium]|nr:hypothetical protein [Thermoleophilaceae bacterium]